VSEFITTHVADDAAHCIPFHSVCLSSLYSAVALILISVHCVSNVCQGGYIFINIYLFVGLFVSKIMQKKLLNKFSQL